MKKFIFCIFFLFITSCGENQDNGHNPEVDMPELPDQEMWDFEITTTNKGMLEAIVKAGHMQRYSDRSTSYFDEGVHIDFFDGEGKIASVLTADGGELEEATMNVKAVGNVVVVSDSGGTLYTDELFYNKDQDRIYSNVDVKIIPPEGGVLYGKGFESDTEMKNIVIRNAYDSVSPASVDLSMDRYTKNDSTESATADSLTDSTRVPLADSLQITDSTQTIIE